METEKCPLCREVINSDAIICKHCHERVFLSRADFIMSSINDRIRIAMAGAKELKQEISHSEALCYVKFSHDQVALKECLDECKLANALAAIAEKLHRELNITMAGIIWGGGDIDPLPFEKAVREQFSRPMKA